MTKTSGRVVLILSLMSFGIVSQHGFADTVVGGMITTNTCWAVANSPYIAEQSVLLINGATLTIEPGVVIRFDPGKALSVSGGQLIARGTEACNIVFTANAVPPQEFANAWAYIAFGDESADAIFDENGVYIAGSIIEHAIVQYAGQSEIEGAIRIDRSTPFVSFCTVRHNHNGGVNAYSAPNLRFSFNTLHDNTSRGGVCLDYSPGAMLSHNIICSNSASSGGGMLLTGSAGLSITDNHVFHNTAQYEGGGICVWSSCKDSRFTNNRILYNRAGISPTSGDGGGLYVHNFSDRIALVGNTIAGNVAAKGGGICFKQVTDITGSSNLICSNTATQKGSAVFLYDNAQRVILSGDTYVPTRIIGNIGSEAVYSDRTHQFSVDPLGPGNVDARNVWWGTTDTSDIQNMIYDFFDNASKGIVFYEPSFLGWADKDVPLNWLQDHGLGTDAAAVTGDQDVDGSLNWQEYFAGTDPTNRQSVFVVNDLVSIDNSTFTIRWYSVSSKYYNVLTSSALTSMVWTVVADRVIATPPMNTFTVTVSESSSAFWQVSVEQ